MFSPTKVSFVTVQNMVKDLRRYFPYLKGVACPTSGGVRTTETLASLVDTLALITWHISYLKGGCAVVTVNVSKFRRDILCLCSQ
jgi:hypothetical protein